MRSIEPEPAIEVIIEKYREHVYKIKESCYDLLLLSRFAFAELDLWELRRRLRGLSRLTENSSICLRGPKRSSYHDVAPSSEKT